MLTTLTQVKIVIGLGRPESLSHECEFAPYECSHVLARAQSLASALSLQLITRLLATNRHVHRAGSSKQPLEGRMYVYVVTPRRVLLPFYIIV